MIEFFIGDCMKYIGFAILLCSIIITCLGWLSIWANPFPPGFIIYVPNGLFKGIYLFIIPPNKSDIYNASIFPKKYNKTTLTDEKIVLRRKARGICWILMSLLIVVLYFLLW